MVSELLLIFAPLNYTPVVSVQAAYTIHTQAPAPVSKCCGRCKNGVITQGDGHKTPCPCPPDCKCRVKSVLKCENGACNTTPAK